MEHKRCMEESPTEPGCGEMPNKKDSDVEFHEDLKIDVNQDLGNSFVSPTPEKPEWSSKARVIASLSRKQLAEEFNSEDLTEQSSRSLGIQKRNVSNELPEKYIVLADLFNRLDTSIRLLELRQLMPTFCSICTQVEILTKRKFLCSHLAQMIYIFPEAFQLEKILVHDKESLLVVPDMKIMLLKDAVKHNSHPDQSVSISLCKAFRERLLSFVSTHPEGTDIPEAMLPEPFNYRSQDLPLELPEKSCTESHQISVEIGVLSSASLFPSSFKRQFSEKLLVPETNRTQLIATQAVSECTGSSDQSNEMIESSSLAIKSSVSECTGSSDQSNEMIESSSFAIKSSAAMTSSTESCMASRYYESTPVKGTALHFGMNEMIAQTPALQTPKRPVMTPNEKLASENEGLDNEIRLTTSARRSLIYSPTNMERTDTITITNTTQQVRIAKCSSNQTASTKRCLWVEETGGSPPYVSDMDRSRGAQISDDDKLNQTGDRKCNDVLTCLPATFDAICFISQSIKCSVITKEELVHKILSNNLEIEETREAEEHLSLLEGLLPDWISKKAASSGQVLYSIKQTSDAEALRARLIEAV